MRIDWRHDKNAPYARTVDAVTGEVLSPVVMADEEECIVERYVYPFVIENNRVKTFVEHRPVRIEFESEW